MSDLFEQRLWKNQTRYSCNQFWESGTKCEFDTHSMELMEDHIRTPHTYSGKPLKTSRQRVSPILDSDGNQIVHTEPSPEFQDYQFKEE
jgi:hypothetical protein